MTHRRIRTVLAAFAGALLLATGCGPTGPALLPTPRETPQPGGRVVQGSTSDIVNMQPLLANDLASARINELLYEYMIQPDPRTGEPKPRLATWSISPDGLTYTFQINARADWSDGKPIIAEDYVTYVKLACKSKRTVRKSSFQDIEGFKDCSDGKVNTITGLKVDPVNAKKWTVKLTKVSCPALLDLSVNLLPTQVFGKYATDLSKDEIDSAPENANPTVFSGPFKFKEWRKGEQVLLTRNDTYWQGTPNLDEFAFKVVANATAVASGLRSGELTFGTIDAKDYADMQKVDSVQIQRYQSLGYTFIGWNMASPTAVGLADKRVRQALAYGLDMDAVIKEVVSGEATRQVAHHVPVQWAYPSAPLEPYRFDKGKAEQLLRDAGWLKGADGILVKDGKSFNLTLSTSSGNAQRETFAQRAAEQYRALGINAQPRPEPFQGLVTKLATGDMTVEATILEWSLLGDVDPYLVWHSSQIPSAETRVEGFGFTAFKDAAMDKAIEEGRNPSNGDCSTTARKKQYEVFNRILNENQPYNFGYSPNVLAASGKALQNYRPGSYSAIYNVQEWWIRR
jgi:peptide/nickel transport system substrate-binding protein